ncbi:MAG: hypothetical protein HGB11_07010, partial [Chlorobiales bacterium]|nr:hypothetical protein [Chlorobiales bacterium]
MISATKNNTTNRAVKAFFSSVLLLMFGLFLSASPVQAQAKKGAAPAETKKAAAEVKETKKGKASFTGEISDVAAFNADIRSKGAKATLFGLYIQRIKMQIGEFEKAYAPLEYNADSLQAITNRVMQDNQNEVMANAIDLSQGVSFKYKKFSLPRKKFNGKLSDSVEKVVLAAKWTSPNKAPLNALKAQTPDFGPELEQILVNEANKEGLVETQLRAIIYERVKARLNGGLVYSLGSKDVLGTKIGAKLESYILANYQVALAKKKIDELVNLVDIVDKY